MHLLSRRLVIFMVLEEVEKADYEKDASDPAVDNL